MNQSVKSVFESEEQYQLATYKKMPITAERGEGVWIYTSDGDKYLDLYGGHAVAGTGQHRGDGGEPLHRPMPAAVGGPRVDDDGAGQGGGRRRALQPVVQRVRVHVQ